MFNYIRKKFALSLKGAKDLIKGSLFSAFVNLIMMIPVGLFILMLNELLDNFYKGNPIVPDVYKYTIFIVATLIVMFVFHYLQYSSVFIATYRESARIRITLAEKLRILPLSFFGKKDLSDLTSSLMGDCSKLEHAFSHAVPQFFGAILSTTIITISLIFLDWRMGISVLWVLPVAFVMIFTSKHIQKMAELKHFNTNRACADGIQECLENMQDIKAYSIQKEYLENLDIKLDKSEKAHIKAELTMGSCVTSAQAVLRLGLATVVLTGTTLLINGETNFITYLIFLITASRLYDPLSGTLSNIAEIFNIEIPIDRMKNIETQPIQSGDNEYKLNGYDIEFRNVTFSYDSSEMVLKNVSFTAKQGEITALIGESGSGKSTAAKLSARFWDLNSGSIFLGGRDISTIEPEALLKNYTIVFQDVTLFNDTVMENIRLGRLNATDDEVLRAAKLALCDEFVLKMPCGYRTIIGENGTMLSGGERQRISIARALLKDAPIVLLDEATASLDVENETKIQKAISELVKNKTVIIVAHRMRTIENADKIIVLKDGVVKETGSSSGLLQKDSIYKQMVEIQSQTIDWSL